MEINSESLLYIFLAVFIGYFSGCINGAQIIGKIKGIDIKNSGLKNAGASNATILLGKKAGGIVFLIDILKTILPILIFKYLLNKEIFPLTIENELLYIVGASVILGHNFPITMKFKGGKGTASLIGMMFAIDLVMGTIGFMTILTVSLITDYLLIGVFAMYIGFIVVTYSFGFGLIPVILAISLLILSLVLHIENFNRLFNHTEKKVSSVFKKSKQDND